MSQRALLLLASLVGHSALSAQPLSKRFKDCKVVCDNVHDCRVVGLTDGPMTQEGQSDALELDLWRRAGPGGEELLVLSQSSEFKPRGLKLDGVPAPELDRLPWKERKVLAPWLPGDDLNQEVEYQWVLEDPAAIRTFIDRVRGAKVLSVKEIVSSPEDLPAPLATSLEGWNASLLAVDALQGRLGTKTAWVRRGKKPESAALPAERPPRAPHPQSPPPLSQAEEQRILDAAKRREGSDLEINAYPLSADKALVIIEVGAGGAGYNISEAMEIVSRNTPRVPEPFLLPAPQDPPGKPSQDPGELYRAEFDPKTLTVTTRYNGRGLGDCGSMRTWRFDGARFVLIAASSMDVCAGLRPSAWPVEWVTVP